MQVFVTGDFDAKSLKKQVGDPKMYAYSALTTLSMNVPMVTVHKGHISDLHTQVGSYTGGFTLRDSYLQVASYETGWTVIHVISDAITSYP